jgi:hypothetical protein
MADINELVKKYVPKNDVPVIGEDVFWDEKNNAVVVKNAYGTSIYNPDGNLLYGKGALYDTNIGSVSGKSVQLFGRNDEIAAEASGDEAAIERIRNERLAREGAYSTGGIKGLVSYLNTDGVPSTTTTGIQNSGGNASVVSTYTDPTTGDVTAVLSNGTTRVLAKSGKQEAERKSAYDLLYQQFNDLGIGGLVPELKSFIEEGISPAEFTLRLRQTDSYKKRFAANAQRIGKGLRALSEAEYIGLEDQYQNVMRQYGLPESYYTRGEMGR